MSIRESWYPFEEGATLGKPGCENGVTLVDEELWAAARICLERGGRHPFSITCGVYGTMVHTCFYQTEADARDAYQRMKPRLAGIVELLPRSSDPDPDFDPSNKAVSKFVCDFQ